MSTSTENRYEQSNPPTAKTPQAAEQSGRRTVQRRLKTSRAADQPSGAEQQASSRRRKLLRWGIGLAALIILVLLPLLNIRIPGLLPGATYEPGALHLMALCMVFGAIALTYHMFLGVAGTGTRLVSST